MRFNGLDLNLLVALQALLDARSITQAAERLNLSQPATSNALGRLREYFGDELLASSGRQMVLTPRAEGLRQPVREVLMRIETTIAANPIFDPRHADTLVKMLVSDLTIAIFMPSLIERLYREAPGLKIELLLIDENPVELIERGDADLLFIPGQYVSNAHPSAPVYEESYVCVTWEGNERIKSELTFDDYLEAGHVAALFGGARAPAFDSWFLERFGVSRQVEVTAPTLGALASLVVGTSRIATVHRRLAQRDIDRLPIRIWEPPIEIPRLVQTMQWHKYRNDDPLLSWLRAIVLDVGANL